MRTPSRTTSAPTPFGPPNLWPLSETSWAVAHISPTSSHANAWMASLCRTAFGARSATISAMADSGWIVPTSLLTAMTDTSETVESSASAS